VILVHATSGCELHDTASTNGTFVNGHRIHDPVPQAPVSHRVVKSVVSSGVKVTSSS
jgi:hypothetical protein